MSHAIPIGKETKIMINSIYMTNEQVEALRNLNETLATIKAVRRQFKTASQSGDNIKAKEIMGNLIALYASLGDAEISAVAYVSAHTKKQA